MRSLSPPLAVARQPFICAVPQVWSSRLALIGITLLGFGLRLPLVDRFPLREDEALYGYWALYFAHNDPLWLHVWPDKPPLFLWLLAAAFHWLGPSQASAQLLNCAISTLTIPLVAAIANCLWGRQTALLAALAMSLNPFAISFAATAFTDPLLVLAGLLSLLAALRRRPFWAGLWLGAAIMTKQQGVLYTPLVVALYCCALPAAERLKFGRYWPFGAGLAALCLPIVYWDSLRWAVAPSPWALSVAHYGVLTVAPPATWPSRLAAWFELVWQLAASWPVWIGLAALAGGWLWQRLTSRPDAGCAGEKTALQGNAARRVYSQTIPTGHALLIAILGMWASGFLLLHLITTVQVWDRYLLPLAPMLALAVAGLAGHWLGSRAASRRGLALALVCLLGWSPAVAAAQGRLPIGSDHGAYQGLREAISWLHTTAPDGVVLYHQTLGWHYQFYLFDDIAAGRYDLRWFPSAVYLADSAVKAPHRQRVLLVPDWAPVPALAQQLAVRGLTEDTGHRFGNFML
ncbi:MAG TPA: glycosyltransferase family 39 protein, partial [Caldilineaceae bacterium]|nr:glycosyltransferase family 39 protein [Caldilineaceae bacterium]